VRREVALGVPSLALVAVGGLWAQAQRAANAPLPHFGDLDPTGRYGPEPDEGTRPLSITVLGDSSLTGPGLFHGSQVWIARIAQRLGRPVTVRSNARGGARVRAVLDHQLPRATAAPTDLFVVSVGANDAVHATTSRSFRRDLAELVDRLRIEAPVVCLGVGDMSMIPRIPTTLRPLLAGRCRAIDRAHSEVCRPRDDVHRIPVADVSDPHFRAGGIGLFAGDLFHPNAAGHALWAELFEPWIRRALPLHVHPVRA
jgi:lysophospholipase L1-like esterase